MKPRTNRTRQRPNPRSDAWRNLVLYILCQLSVWEQGINFFLLGMVAHWTQQQDSLCLGSPKCLGRSDRPMLSCRPQLYTSILFLLIRLARIEYKGSHNGVTVFSFVLQEVRSMCLKTFVGLSSHKTVWSWELGDVGSLIVAV